MDFRANLPVFAKKWVWNLKYGAGKYAMDSAPTDAISQLSPLPGKARILELGCGAGSLLRGLRKAGWQGHYCGVDISQRAIHEAEQFEGMGDCSWRVSDIESFVSNEKWDVIAMIESVYYVQIDTVTEVFRRIARMLNPGGYVLLRIHDFVKHCKYIDAINGMGWNVERKDNLLLIRPTR